MIGDGGNNADFEVMLRLREISPSREVWTARSKVSVLTANLFTDDKKSGEKIGKNFFELMKNSLPICN